MRIFDYMRIRDLVNPYEEQQRRNPGIYTGGVFVQTNPTSYVAHFVTQPFITTAPDPRYIVDALRSSLLNTYSRRGETSQQFFERFQGVFIIQNINNPGKSWAMNNGQTISLKDIDPAIIVDGAESILQSQPTLRLRDFTFGFFFPETIEGILY